MPSCNLQSCSSARAHRRAVALYIVVAIAAIAATVTPSPAWAGGFAGSNEIQTGTDTIAPGSPRAFNFNQNTTTAGTISRLSIYLDATNTASQVTLGLYANSSSRPGRRLAFCTVTAPRAGAWNSCPISPLTISTRSYWGAILQPMASTGTIRFRDVSSGGGDSYSSSTGSMSTLPTNFRVGQRGSGAPVSMFADLPPTPAPEPTPDPPPTTPPPAGSPTLQQVDGGTGYYGQFTSGLPTSAGYFPISVWGAYDFTVANVAKDKAVGLNLYVWNADPSAIGAVEHRRGRYADASESQ